MLLVFRLKLCMHAKFLSSAQSYGLYSPGSTIHGIPPGNNTAVSCLALLQGIFLTQGSPALQADSLPFESLLLDHFSRV